MWKKGFQYVRGFMKMSTLVIIFILLVSLYVWQDKVEEITGNWFESSRKEGVLAPAEGIWNKMKSVKNNQDNRSQRALELMGETKEAGDEANTYSIKIPVTWTIAKTEVLKGSQISKTVFTNPSFSLKKEGNNFFYEDGAELSIEVTKGDRGGSDHGSNLVATRSVAPESGEGNFEYHVIKDPLVKSGEIMDAHIARDGKTYYIRYAFNPFKFYGGEYTFEEFLFSLKFINK